MYIACADVDPVDYVDAFTQAIYSKPISNDSEIRFSFCGMTRGRIFLDA